jgi:iron(III) transport system substrate-binding protein
MPRSRSTILLLVVVLALSACGGAEEPSDQAAGAAGGTDSSSPDAASVDEGATAATGAGTAGGQEAACEAALDEGPLDWWTQDPATAERIIELFNEDYPDITVEFTYLTENDIAQRLVSEADAGRETSADLTVGNLSAFAPAIERGLINQEVEWPAEIPENLITPSNMVRISRRAAGLVYNTNEFTAEELPETWEELVDPRYAGLVSVHATGIPFNYFVVPWGEEATVDWATNMAQVVQPAVIEGTTASIQAAASGEVPIAASGRDSEAREQQAAGAPVEIKYLDLVPAYDFHQAIPTGAQDLNAAVCLASWYVNEGHEDIFAINFAANEDVPPDAPEGAEIIVLETDDIDATAEMGEQISQIWLQGG